MKLTKIAILVPTFLALNSLELKTHACSIKPQGMTPGKHYASCSEDNYKEIPFPSHNTTNVNTVSANQQSIADFTNINNQSNTVETHPGTTLENLIRY